MTRKRRKATERAESATDAAERLSGVSVRSDKAAAGEADRTAQRRNLARRCAVMGWEATEANLRKARDQKLADLHGRLLVAGRIGEEQFDAIERFLELDALYGRVCLDRPQPSRGEMPVDPVEPHVVADDWRAADKVVHDAGRRCRNALRFVLDAADDVSPHDTRIDIDGLRVVAKGLARHFGLVQ